MNSDYNDLNLYDLNLNKISKLNDNTLNRAKNIVLNERINEISTLTFDIPNTNKDYEKLRNEDIVECGLQLYKIKNIAKSSNNNKTVTAIHLSSVLSGMDCCPFLEESGENNGVAKTLEEFCNMIFKNTGWSFGLDNVSSDIKLIRKTFLSDIESCYSIIIKIAELFGLQVIFNASINAKYKVIFRDMPKETSLILNDNLLQSVEVSYDSSEMVTHMQVYGGMDINTGQEITIFDAILKDENGNIVYKKDQDGNFVLDENGQKIPEKYGKSYIEDYSYYIGKGYSQDYIDKNKHLFIKQGIWNPSEYIDVDVLFEDAKKKMEIVSKPIFKCTIAGIQGNNEYIPADMKSNLGSSIGRKIKVYHENKIYSSMIIARTTEFDNMHKLNIELSDEIEYSSVTGSNNITNDKINDNLTANGELSKINGKYINGVIDILKAQLMSTKSHWYTDKDGNMIFENPEKTACVKIGAGIIALANTKDIEGNYNFRAFGSGNGFTADEICLGILKGGLVQWDLEKGTFYIGKDFDTNFKIKFDGTDLIFGEGVIKWDNLDSTSKDNISGVRLQIIGGVTNLFFDKDNNCLTSIQPFEVVVKRNNKDILATSYKWEVGGMLNSTNSNIDSKTFIPNVNATFNPLDTWVKVTCVVDTHEYTEYRSIGLSKVGANGENAYYIVMSSESVSLPCNQEGTDCNLENVKTTFSLYNGINQVGDTRLSINKVSNCTASIIPMTNDIKLDTVSNIHDYGYVDINVLDGTRLIGTKRWSWSKAKQGGVGKTYRLEIVGGTRTIIYDGNSSNPKPSILQPFSTKVYENDILVDPNTVEYKWEVGKNGLLINPSNVIGVEFVPNVNSKYNSDLLDNNISVTVKFGNPIKVMTTTVPISITKQGDTGKNAFNVSLSTSKGFTFLQKGNENIGINETIISCTANNMEEVTYNWYVDGVLTTTNRLNKYEYQINYSDFTLDKLNINVSCEAVGKVNGVTTTARDSITLIKVVEGRDGEDSYNIECSNESVTFPCNKEGLNAILNNNSTIISLYKGNKIIPISEINLSKVDTNCTSSINNNIVTINSISNTDDTGSVEIIIKHNQVLIGKRMFTWSKSKQGADGLDSFDINIISDNGFVFKIDEDDLPVGYDTLNLMCDTKFITNATYKWYKNDILIQNETTNKIAIKHDSFTNNLKIKCEVMGISNKVNVNLEDTVVINKILDAKSTYIATLSNENISIPYNTSGNPIYSDISLFATTDIELFRGLKQVDVILGDNINGLLKPKATGCTIESIDLVIKNNVKTYNLKVNSLTDSMCKVEIPVYNKNNVLITTKVFNLNKSIQGEDSYSIILSNENMLFVCENDGTKPIVENNVTDIKVFKGDVEINDFVLSKIDTNCTSSILNNKVTIDSILDNKDNGNVKITITHKNKIIGIKTLSWNKSKKSLNGQDAPIIDLVSDKGYLFKFNPIGGVIGTSDLIIKANVKNIKTPIYKWYIDEVLQSNITNSLVVNYSQLNDKNNIIVKCECGDVYDIVSISKIIDGRSIEIEYSIDGLTNWTSNLNATLHKFMRQRLQGDSIWGTPVKFVGDDGVNACSINILSSNGILFKLNNYGELIGDSSTTLNVVCRGFKEISSYKWYKNGVFIPVIKDNVTVKYSDIVDKKKGIFKCEVTGLNNKNEIVTLTDEVTLSVIEDGVDSYNISCTNENIIISCDEIGNIIDESARTSELTLYKGLNKLPLLINSIVANGCTVNYSMNNDNTIATLTITNFVKDDANIIITVTDKNKNIRVGTKTINLTKVYAGLNAYSMYIETTSDLVFDFDATNELIGDKTITLNSKIKNILNPTYEWFINDIKQISTDNKLIVDGNLIKFKEELKVKCIVNGLQGKKPIEPVIDIVTINKNLTEREIDAEFIDVLNKSNTCFDEYRHSKFRMKSASNNIWNSNLIIFNEEKDKYKINLSKNHINFKSNLNGEVILDNPTSILSVYLGTTLIPYYDLKCEVIGNNCDATISGDTITISKISKYEDNGFVLIRIIYNNKSLGEERLTWSKIKGDTNTPIFNLNSTDNRFIGDISNSSLGVSNIDITANVTGLTNIVYRWYLNGNILNNKTNKNTISYSQVIDYAIIKCEVIGVYNNKSVMYADYVKIIKIKDTKQIKTQYSINGVDGWSYLLYPQTHKFVREFKNGIWSNSIKFIGSISMTDVKRFHIISDKYNINFNTNTNGDYSELINNKIKLSTIYEDKLLDNSLINYEIQSINCEAKIDNDEITILRLYNNDNGSINVKGYYNSKLIDSYEIYWNKIKSENTLTLNCNNNLIVFDEQNNCIGNTNIIIDSVSSINNTCKWYIDNVLESSTASTLTIPSSRLSNKESLTVKCENNGMTDYIRIFKIIDSKGKLTKYSIDKVNWHLIFDTKIDKYIKQDNIEIQFIDNDIVIKPNDYVDYRFLRSIDVPDTPKGNNPSSWMKQPVNIGEGKIWLSMCYKNSNDEIQGVWTIPVQIKSSERYKAILDNENVILYCGADDVIPESSYAITNTFINLYNGSNELKAKIYSSKWEKSESEIIGNKIQFKDIAGLQGSVHVNIFKDDIYLETKTFKFVLGKQGNDGLNAKNYNLVIENGIRNLTYFADGSIDPVVKSIPFEYKLYENETLITTGIKSQEWKSKGLLSGTTTSTTFTPLINSIWDKNLLNTYITLNVIYNGVVVSQSVSITISKEIKGIDWLDEWNTNTTEIGGDKIVSPKIFAGSKNASGKLSGVAIGREVIKGTNKEGIVGYYDDLPTYHINTDGSAEFGLQEIDKKRMKITREGKLILPEIESNKIVVKDGNTLDGELDKIQNNIDNNIQANLSVDNSSEYLFHFDNDTLSTNGIHPEAPIKLITNSTVSNKVSNSIILTGVNLDVLKTHNYVENHVLSSFKTIGIVDNLPLYKNGIKIDGLFNSMSYITNEDSEPIYPYYIASIRENGGMFKNAIAIEQDSENLIKGKWYNWTSNASIVEKNEILKLKTLSTTNLQYNLSESNIKKSSFSVKIRNNESKIVNVILKIYNGSSLVKQISKEIPLIMGNWKKIEILNETIIPNMTKIEISIVGQIQDNLLELKECQFEKCSMCTSYMDKQRGYGRLKYSIDLLLDVMFITSYKKHLLEDDFKMHSIIKDRNSFKYYINGDVTTSYKNKWLRTICNDYGDDIESFKNPYELSYVLSNFGDSMLGSNQGFYYKTFIYSNLNMTYYQRYDLGTNGSLIVSVNHQLPKKITGLWETQGDIAFNLKEGWNCIEFCHSGISSSKLVLKSNSQGKNLNYSSENANQFIESKTFDNDSNILYMTAELPVDICSNKIDINGNANILLEELLITPYLKTDKEIKSIYMQKSPFFDTTPKIDVPEPNKIELIFE